MLICDCMCAYENQDALLKIHGFIHLAAVQSYCGVLEIASIVCAMPVSLRTVYYRQDL